MAACTEHYTLPDELQDTSTKDTTRTSTLHGKDARCREEQQSAAFVSRNESSLPSVALKDVKQHVTCALCSNLIASCLVLSCGHQYCGSCLFDWLGNKPSCPNCQVPLRAIPMRCIALDGVVEAFLASLPEHEVVAHKARQEEGKSAANKVNKMFWWLQPSALPGMPPSGPTGFGGASNNGMSHMGGMMGQKQQSYNGQSMPQHLPTGGMMTAGMMGGGYNPSGKGMQQAPGSMRRASQPGAPQQQGFPSRPGARSNSFSAGGALPNCMPQPMLPPQMAASIAAAGFTSPNINLPGSNADLEAAYLATAQKFGMEGLALPLVYQQQLQQQLHQQEQFRGLLHACSELQAVDLASSSQVPYADQAQLQQLLQGLYFA